MPTFPYPRAKLRFALKIFRPAFLKKAGGVQGGTPVGPGAAPRQVHRSGTAHMLAYDKEG